MTDESKTTLSLFCASLEEDIHFTKLSALDLKKISKLRESTVFFTEYARIVIYAVVGKKKADTIWGKGKSPIIGGNHTLFELYWISTIINPELSWSLKIEQDTQEKQQLSRQIDKSRRHVLLDKMPQIESRLRSNIIGQEEAVETVIDVLYRSAAGLSDPDRPQAVLMFTGQSGTGKTLLAKELSAAMNESGINKNAAKEDSSPSDKSFFRIDCTLFQQRHEISNLIGAPASYVGFDLGSPLPQFLKDNPDGCVVLIDEVEKAHPALHKIFMGLFDYGRIKDNKQNDISAHNAFFIMTSNAGSKEASSEVDKCKRPFGFAETKSDIQKLTEKAYRKKLEDIFPPEFRGRIDETIVFKPLNDESFGKILDLEINKINIRLKDNGVELTISDEAKKHILEQGTSQEFGARKLSSNLNDMIIKPLSKLIVKTKGKSFICDYKDDELKVEQK